MARRARRCRPIRSSAARSGSHRRHRARIGRPPLPRGAHPLLGRRLATAVPIFETMLSAQRPPTSASTACTAPHWSPGPCSSRWRRPRPASCADRRTARSRSSSSASRWCCRRQDASCSFTSRRARRRAAVLGPQPHRPMGPATGSCTRRDASCRRPQPSACGGAQTPLRPDRAGLGRSIAVRSRTTRNSLALASSSARPSAACRQARRQHREVLASLALPQACAADAVVLGPSRPARRCLAGGRAVRPAVRGRPEIYLLTEIDRVELAGPLPAQFLLPCTAARCARAATRADGAPTSRLRADDGAVLGVIHGVDAAPCDRARRCSRGRGRRPTRDLFYQVAWEPAPVSLRASHSLAGAGAFVPRVRERFGSLAVEHGVSIYEQLLPELDRLSVEHVGRGPAPARLRRDAGPRVLAAAEAATLRIAPRHARLFARLLEMLAEERRAATARRRASRSPARCPRPIRRRATTRLVQRFGEVDGELSTLRRCGPALARVLYGRAGSAAAAVPRRLVRRGAQALRRVAVRAHLQRRARRGAAAAIAALPPDEPPARAGDRRRHRRHDDATCCRCLPAERVEYTFTDLSPLFLERAAEQFQAYPFVRARCSTSSATR